jgi:hypothetical protein
MEIVQDLRIKNTLKGNNLSKVKELAKYIKENFKDVDVADIKINILKNPTYHNSESYVFFDYKVDSFELKTPSETTIEKVTDELLDNFPKESQHLLNQESDWGTVCLSYSDNDVTHPYVKEILKEQTAYLESCDIVNEALTFWLSPASILYTHTDGSKDSPMYSLLVNIESNNSVKLKVDDRIIDMGLYDAFIFDATNSPHALWNPSADNWSFICIRLEKNLFES